MKSIITLILSQEGKNMVIAILLIGLSVMGTVVYNQNSSLMQCISSKETLLIDFHKKSEEKAEREAQKYEEKLIELENRYREKEIQTKWVNDNADAVIKETKIELNKIKNSN